MVSVTERVYEGTVFLVPSYLILYYAFQLYNEAGTGKKAGSLACSTGECDRAFDGCDMVFFLAKQTDIPDGSIYLLLCQYYHGSICQKYGEDGLRKARKNGYNQKHMILVGWPRGRAVY